MYLGWKDKCNVYMMSACISDNISNVTRTGKFQQVLEVIETYNIAMGGIDKSNQMLTSYVQIREKKTQKMVY